MEIIKSNLVLTFDELRILLYSQGFRRCEGVYMPEKEFSQENIINALNKLGQNGLLTIGEASPAVEALPLVFGDDSPDTEPEADAPEEEFYIRSDLLTMIGIIGKPEATEILELSPERRVFCYYSDDGVVTSERYPGRRECVRLTLYSDEEFRDWRESLGEEQE